MAYYDFSGRPYYDRFKESKNITRVLFKPDVPLQNSELNEMDSINHSFLQRLGDSIFKDGDMQSGLDYTIDGNNVLTVNPGYLYIQGKMRYYDAKDTVKLTGVGKEQVGIKVVGSIITSDDDNSLLDPATGTPSYFSEGADRYKEELKLTLNDPSSATIYTFQNGDLFTKPSDPQFDKVVKVMEQRTFEESGSYKVQGLTIFSAEDQEEDSGYVNIVVDTGVAYVKGRRIEKPTSTRIQLDSATDIENAQNESTIYNKTTDRIRLANSPVKDIKRVSASVLVEKERKTRDAIGDSQDYLANTTAYKINRVWTEGSGGEVTKEYKQGTDYNLIDGQAVDWSPGGQEPQSGASYYVSYEYTKRLENGVDYVVEEEGEGQFKRWFLNFSKATGVKPIDQTLVQVDYTFYLARQDLLSLNVSGEIVVLKGKPNLMRLVNPPIQEDPETLQLGYVTVLPNSTDTDCVTDAITNLSMEQLQKVKTRVDNLEINQAINALDDGAMEGQNPLNLRSVFSEGFISLDKADISHPDFGVAFSFDDAEITLQFTEEVQSPNVSEITSNAHIWGRIISAPFTEELSIYQPLASEPLNVNPYNIPNKQGVMKLTPSEDNWIDEERVTVTEQKTKTITMNRWWRHPGRDFGSKQDYYQSNIQLDKGQVWEGNTYAYDREHGRTGTLLESGGHRTLEEMIEFIRQRQVKIDVKGLNPNDNDLYLLFDGIRCALTPESGYRKGSEPGTVMSDEKGRVKATFEIPAGVRCGNREVTLKNANSTSATTYSAHGRKKITQDIILKTRVTINLVDPLAQSFQYDENRIISSLGLYFASKGDAQSNVTIQIRGMGDQGFPNKVVYAETVLNADDIKVSKNASAETRVYFDDPMMAEAGREYAIVIMTENSDYTMWVGTRTQPRIDKPSENISGNPYVQGVLFSSSNASTWTPHQNSDLKFGIYTPIFEKEAVIEFDSMKNVKADRLVLMSTYLTPENTGCAWEAKILREDMDASVTIDSLPWQPIANYQDLELIEIAKEVKLKATFDANKYISPLLSVSDLTFTSFLTELTGSYVGRAIDMAEAPYNTVRFSYEGFLPKGAKIVPRYSADNGETWKTFTTQPKTQKANNEFTRYVFDEKVTTGEKYKKLQVRLDLSTENSFLRPRCRRLMVTTRDE